MSTRWKKEAASKVKASPAADLKGCTAADGDLCSMSVLGRNRRPLPPARGPTRGDAARPLRAPFYLMPRSAQIAALAILQSLYSRVFPSGDLLG